MEEIKRIFKLAKDRGLKNVSIVIFDSENEWLDEESNDNQIYEYTLVVGIHDRFTGHATLNSLEKAIEEHIELGWMNK